MLLTEKKFGEALTVLDNAPFDKVSNFVYKIVPVLFEMIPEKTVNVLLSKPQFQISHLLPSILRYVSKFDDEKSKRTDHINFAVLYVEEYFKKMGLFFTNCQDNIGISYDQHLMVGMSEEENINIDLWVKSELEPIALHLLGHLYAKYDKQETKLCNFLQTLLNLQELNALQEVVDVDIEYILRQCRIYQRRKGGIYALILLGNFKQSVEEALHFNTELAKSIVRRHPEAELRKEMWIQIAKSILAVDTDIKKVVLLVKESSEDVRIEVS
jgi:hypothetical protein